LLAAVRVFALKEIGLILKKLSSFAASMV